MEDRMWHIIDGEWVDLMQITKGTTRKYYTNGILEGVAEVDENGIVIKCGVKDEF
jgi:hypothetical protein